MGFIIAVGKKMGMRWDVDLIVHLSLRNMDRWILSKILLIKIIKKVEVYKRKDSLLAYFPYNNFLEKISEKKKLWSMRY